MAAGRVGLESARGALTLTTARSSRSCPCRLCPLKLSTVSQSCLPSQIEVFETLLRLQGCSALELRKLLVEAVSTHPAHIPHTSPIHHSRCVCVLVLSFGCSHTCVHGHVHARVCTLPPLLPTPTRLAGFRGIRGHERFVESTGRQPSRTRRVHGGHGLALQPLLQFDRAKADISLRHAALITPAALLATISPFRWLSGGGR